MNQATNLAYLSDLSPKDKRWDKRKAEAEGIKNLYVGTEYNSYVARIRECSRILVFSFAIADNGVCELKLSLARFCRVPLCPVCQGRRALKWTAKVFKIMPQLREQYPKSRFIFLTLTVRNCQVSELRSTLTEMNKAWTRLTHRKEWPAQGWIRTVEVTRSKDDTAHPHFHCLLMVRPGYFGNAYMSQERWKELWRDCLRVSYDPSVDVRAIRPSTDLPEDIKDDPLAAAIVEAIKYGVKPTDILRGDFRQKPGQMTDQQWLLKFTNQMHKTRCVATGGILKSYLKVLEEETDSDSDDLIHIDEDSSPESDLESPTTAFDWNGDIRRYQTASNPLEDEIEVS